MRRALSDWERAQREEEREEERARKQRERERVAAEKAHARGYAEQRQAETDSKNQSLERRVADLQRLLTVTLQVDDYLDFERLKTRLNPPDFRPGALAQAEMEPVEKAFLPPPLSFFQRLLGQSAKHALRVVESKEAFRKAVREHGTRDERRRAELEAARAAHEHETKQIREQQARQHAEIDVLKQGFEAGQPDAVTRYFSLVLEASVYPAGIKGAAKVAFVPESKQLVVECDLPAFDAIPEAGAYKYVKAQDQIAESPRPASQRRALYASVLAQMTLRTLHELFEADRMQKLGTVVFNGYVDTIDRATGRRMRPCLITVRTTREAFEQLDLSRVDPIACLKALNAGVSRSPAELAAVKPIVEFSMVDPRFVESGDVLSTLDQRPNLMRLTPTEFEELITNLFEKMGLETRLTQASRDGGVDCVAYDTRPIFGGKVVIQAKRYKHTVGVSAVRDLYGTMQNEGATKGILVTTSGYGSAAFDFAKGKPLELLSGSHLLHLLAEHAGIEAKIEPPDDWRDPMPDQEQTIGASG